MKRLAIPVLCVVVAGCTDTFTERYSTLDAARRDQIFERGWLPDVLPASAHGLRVCGDVDINVTEGEFSFRGTDLEEFLARLQPMPLAEALPDAVAEWTGELANNGHVARAYVREGYTWIFLCSEERERCEYRGWPKR